VGFVQTPKECLVPVGDPFGNRDRIFYDSIQVGRDGDNAAFACGSGVIWNIAALDVVGGFNTWNVVEDMTTSYEIHNAGFSSVYHNELLSVGLAPDDIPGVLKQRGTWAVDTWRMFLFNNPLWKRGKLTLAQRLQYLELGLFYCTSAFVMPLMFLVPVLSLLTGDFLTVEGAILFPWLLCTMLYHVVHADGSLSYAWRYWQYWIGHGPTYFNAFLAAVRSRRSKPRYVVTRKTRLGGFHGQLIWPQFLLSLLGLASVVAGAARFGAEQPIFVATNAVLLLYYLFLLNGICSAAFYGVGARDLPLIGPVLRLGERVETLELPRPLARRRVQVEARPLEPAAEPLIALERGSE
jgi:cellulose synthase (UDP-forming)